MIKVAKTLEIEDNFLQSVFLFYEHLTYFNIMHLSSTMYLRLLRFLCNKKSNCQ